MHKLTILIQETPDPPAFEAGWPEFLHLAEGMPGLLREVTSRVTHQIYGDFRCKMVHELIFASEKEARQALQSAIGQAAGRTLQAITQGGDIFYNGKGTGNGFKEATNKGANDDNA